MATNFPTSLDNLTNPAGSDPVNNPSHATQHANINDAIEVLEEKVGVTNSTVTTSLDYRVKQLETNPTYTNEEARDAIALALRASGGITVSSDDIANTITVSTDSTIATKTYVDTAVSNLGSTAASTYVPVSEVGQADGIATLDATGQVPFSQLGNLVASAPATLDTLNELATALGNDANFATTTATSIGNKVSKAGGDIITSSLASTIPLVLKGAASQTANLQQWQNSAGGVLLNIDSTGNLDIGAGSSNIWKIKNQTSAVMEWQPSQGFMFLPYGASNRPVTIKGAASQTADLTQWQNDAGTVLVSVQANGYIQGSYINLTSGGGILSSSSNQLYANSGSWLIVAPGPTKNGLIIKGAASQTANLQEWQNSSGGVDTAMTSTGRLSVRTTLADAGLNVGAPSAATVAAIIRGFTSQSANLQQWQDNGGTVIARLTASGSFLSAARVSAGSSTVAAANINSYIPSASLVGILVQGAASQTANLQEWQDSAGTVSAFVDANGRGRFLSAILGSTSSSFGSNLNLQTSAASIVGAIIRGNISQTADLQQWQNSAGTVLTKVDSAGSLTIGTSGTFISASNGRGVFTTSGASQIALVVKGAASQTANLQEWQDSAGTVLSKIDSTGAMFTTTAAANTNTTQVATTEYVKNNINNLINAAPGTLDTLGEIATALAASDSAAAALVTSVNLKAPLASPALTGTPTAPTAVAGTNTTQLATTAFVKTELSTSIQPGALYQTSAPSSPAVGQIWIDSDEDVTTFDPNIIRRKAITATAGQTVFTADLPFIDGFEQIFMNGLLLVKITDYATSGGNTVTLTSAAAVSDVIEIVSVTGANSVDTYTQAEVNALLAANTSVAPLSISANTTLVAKKRYFVTSASALTLTLPASPALNDEIQIVDASGNASTYNITVARNANNINGGTNNLIIDTNGGWYTLLYTGATYGWKVG